MSSSDSSVSSTMPVWVPLVFQNTLFLYSFAFYVIIGALSRQIVARIWQAQDKVTLKKKDTIGRWTPSWIHAVLASILATCATFELVPQSTISNEDVIMHSLGYFMGDLVIDRDPGYIVHHVGPVIHSEIMLRLGAHFFHCMRAGYIMEVGNVFAHTAALITFRRGPTFHKINVWSFWISRPASYYDGFMAWYHDIPEDVRYTWLGLIPLISILGVYHSNTKWMIQMCKKRPPKVEDENANPTSPSTPSTPATPVATHVTTSTNDDSVLTSSMTSTTPRKPRKQIGGSSDGNTINNDSEINEIPSTSTIKQAAPLPSSPPSTQPHVQVVGSRKGKPSRDRDA